MLALLIYCYCTGRFHSRAIEAATYSDLIVRYICGNTHPDHDTICSFRRDNKELMGFRRFSMRGKWKAELEWTLVCTAYNVRRLYNLGDPMPLLRWRYRRDAERSTREELSTRSGPLRRPQTVANVQ